MGTPKERQGQFTEKRVEVSLDGGSIVIPFHFGRQPVSSDAMRARLDGILIAGARVVHPDWWDEYHLSDEAIRTDLEIEARLPEDQAPLMALGFVLSREGFGSYVRPFESLNDPNSREIFRAIADPLIKIPYYNPAQIARRALFRENIVYPDGKERSWDAGELMTHLTIALAERGRVFNTGNDEHAPRISPYFRWPADLAEMLGIAYLLGEGKIEEEIKERVINRMGENIDGIVNLAGLHEEDRQQLVTKSNELAQSEILI